MEQQHFELIKGKIEQLMASMQEHADEQQINTLDDVLRQTLQYVESSDEALFLSIYLAAVKTHLRPGADSHEHIYLQQFEIPQIELFDVLLNKFPFVITGHAQVNHKISEILSTTEKAVLIDVGAGRGLQILKLLKLLSGNSVLKELTIIGIEPFDDALAFASQVINEASAGLNFKVNFIPVASMIEDLDETELKKIIPTDERIIVNAAFVIHHLQTEQERKTFFGLMHKIGANDILLTEPQSDHLEADWKTRAHNAYIHYGALYRLIDKLDIGAKEKKGLKMFFGREIDDVVGNPDDQRFERHEPGEKWITYLSENGFSSAGRDFRLAPELIMPPLELQYHDEGFWCLGYKGADILSLIYALRVTH